MKLVNIYDNKNNFFGIDEESVISSIFISSLCTTSLTTTS